MNIRIRLSQLEARRTRNPFANWTDAELDERIAALVGIEKGATITASMHDQIIKAMKDWKKYQVIRESESEY